MSQSFVIVYLKRHQSTIISCPDCRYQLLLSSLLICSPLWDWSGWEEGSENFNSQERNQALDLVFLRWSAALSMLAVGLTILPCAWLTDQPMAQAIFAMAGRFFATYAMNTGFQFGVEVT